MSGGYTVENIERQIDDKISVPDFSKRKIEEGKEKFYISARQDGKTIRLDILKLDCPQDHIFHFRQMQELHTWQEVPFILLAKVEASLSEKYIKIEYGDWTVWADGLWLNRQTHILPCSMELYGKPANNMIKTRTEEFLCAEYHEDELEIFLRSSDEKGVFIGDGTRFGYRIEDSKIQFMKNSEKVAVISAQIYPWEPQYEGWILEEYKDMIPFFSAGLLVNLFQITG